MKKYYCYYPNSTALTIISNKKENDNYKPIQEVINSIVNSEEWYIVDDFFPFVAIYMNIKIFNKRKRKSFKLYIKAQLKNLFNIPISVKYR